jgi:hypothetical protein
MEKICVLCFSFLVGSAIYLLLRSMPPPSFTMILGGGPFDQFVQLASYGALRCLLLPSSVSVLFPRPESQSVSARALSVHYDYTGRGKRRTAAVTAMAMASSSLPSFLLLLFSLSLFILQNQQ